MNNFDKEFIMELFLDNDNISTMNRLVVAVANVVSENHENVSISNEVMIKQYKETTYHNSKKTAILKVPQTSMLRGLYEMNIVNYTDEDYKKNFKMKASTVQALINFLEDFIKPNTPVVALDKKVHVFLWLMTTNSSYNEVGALFGLDKSTVSYIFYEIAVVLSDQRYNFISWPSLDEQHITRIRVNSQYKFPNCVGFIDACRFKIGSKRNKKHKPDVILLQAVCDESLMFIDIHIGEIGETRKWRVFRDSQLAQELKNFVEFENHILADSQYRLKKNLITPFTNEELLTSEEMKFNELHWHTHAYIGHAFELLKERFRKLNHIDINKVEAINTLICAACVLHNFIIIHEGSSEIKQESIVCNDGVTIDTDVVKSAAEKRQFLCNFINYIDSL